MQKGMDIKLSKTNIRKQVGGSLLSTILSLGARALPGIAKRIGLAGLSAGVETGVKNVLEKDKLEDSLLSLKCLTIFYHINIF